MHDFARVDWINMNSNKWLRDLCATAKLLLQM